MRIGRAIGVAFVLLGGTAFADTVLWDELVDGELGDVLNKTAIPNLVLGTNIIKGYVASGSLDSAQDSWIHSLPNGLQVTGAELFAVASVGSFVLVRYLDGVANTLDAPPPVGSGTTSLVVLDGSFPATSPDWAGVVAVAAAGPTLKNYEFRIFVATSGQSMPEPGTLVLSWIALAGVIALRRRRLTA